ncbi:MAG: 2-hydroxyacyl-CoA dehydratase subunit D [Dissulfuribacterales bacterium]
MKNDQKIGFSCAYTPLALLDAAGYSPFRILPMGDSPDQAGHLLHDNLCPNIKRILDRALSDDIPDLDGMIFINSCDAMRRMADAWKVIRKNDRTILLDLPATPDDLSIAFFTNELTRLKDALAEWCGKEIDEKAIENSIVKFNQIAQLLEKIAPRFHNGQLKGGGAALQTVYNQAATSSLDDTLSRLQQLADTPDSEFNKNTKVPVYLFGNVMPDPEAFELIESCGAYIANDDFCTGNRLFTLIESNDGEDPLLRIANTMLSKPACARTFDPTQPGKAAKDALTNARACDARGVIGHTVKFCDPYLERIPNIRDTLKEAGRPALFLEGDCTLRSIGQQRTRIEAFIEMLR